MYEFDNPVSIKTELKGTIKNSVGLKKLEFVNNVLIFISNFDSLIAKMESSFMYHAIFCTHNKVAKI